MKKLILGALLLLSTVSFGQTITQNESRDTLTKKSETNNQTPLIYTNSVYVNGYYRKNGTYVKGYYRRKN